MTFRNKAGQFAKKTWYWTKVLFFLSPLIGYAIYWAGTEGLVSKVHYVAVAEAAEVCGASCQELAKVLVGQKVEALKDELVEDIGKCESAGAKDPDGLIVFDSNNEASVGHLQFQRLTVIVYIKKFMDKAIDNSDAIAIAIDHKQSHDLAKKIIFEDSKGWKNWFNCGNKVNAEIRIADIKRLEK